MKFAKSAWLAAAAFTLAFGSAQAADNDPPGFNELDKDGDGALSRSEASGNRSLAAQFQEVDSDGNGKLSRMEYLQTMAAKDFRQLREKTAEILEPDGKGKQSGAAAGASRQSGQQAQEGRQALSPELIRKVQQALNAKGHDAGPVDGIWGPLTQRGLRNFQESQPDMQASGRIDAQTLTALGIDLDGSASASAGGSGGKQQSSKQQDKQQDK